ncbi:AEC family transporter [Roseibium aggregatum]|uniref:AEC family transporter n=1 Tax=Roseibium aggregatum TaxID=187304 RepID=A0A926P3U4_9HYPH|nr:AEC family transporter [Roseibium aggregatum]MBD1549230.1 AEC family transporter [Roseibium aggregatum]
MLNVLTISGTIFALIAAGYFAVLKNVFAAPELRVLGKYVINFAVPALIFRAVSSRSPGEVLNTGYLTAFLITSVVLFFFGYHLAKRGFRMSRAESTFHGMGMSCSNSGLIGYPIVVMALPSMAGTALALNMIVETLVMIPLVLIMAERASGGGKITLDTGRQIAVKVLLNPFIIAIIFGMTVSLSGLQLPEIVSKPIGLLASSSVAVSLIVIGGTLAGLPLGAVNLKIAAVVLGKLVLMPAMLATCLAILTAFGLGTGDPVLETAGLLMVATPAMATYPILAQSYGQENTAALAMFAMTILSFFTISALMWFLQIGAG